MLPPSAASRLLTSDSADCLVWTELALKAAGIGTWDWNIPTGEISYNGRWAGMLGYGANEIPPNIGAWHDLVHPDDRAFVDQNIKDHFEGRSEVIKIVHRLRRKNGSWMWVLAHGKVYQRANDGSPLRMAGIKQDISQQKQEEETREALRNTVELLTQIPWVTGPDGASITCDSNWEKFTGRPAVDAGSNLWLNAFHPDDRADTILAWNWAVRYELPYKHTHRLRRADGEYRYCESRAQPARDPIGKVTRWYGTTEDIHERHTAGEALRQSERRFRTLFNNVSDAIFLLDLCGHVVDVNVRACESLGYTRAELLQMNVSDLDEDFDLAAAKRAWETLDSKKTAAFLGRHRRKSGSLLPVEIRLTTCHVNNQLLILALVIDITERVKAEACLKESEARFRGLVEAVPGVLIISDADGQAEFLNPEFLEFTGLSEREACGLGWMSAIHPDDQKLVSDRWLSSVKDGTPFSLEYRLRRRDGSYRWFMGRSVSQRNETGEMKKWYGAASDIDDQKRLEMALERRSAELAQRTYELQAAQRIAKVGHWSWHVSEDWVSWSPELYRIAGLDPGMPAPNYASQQQLYAPASWKRLDAAVRRALECGEAYKLELELVRPDGSRRWTAAEGEAELDSRGTVVKLRGTLQDITERHRIEVRLQTQTAEFNEAQRLLHVGSWSTIFETGERYWSAEYFRLMGLDETASPLTGEQAKAYVRPEIWDVLQQKLARLMTDGTPIELEHELIRLDGQILWVEERAEAIRDEVGQIIGIRGTNQDVTERKRMEDDLREARRVAEEATRAKGDFLASMSHEIRTPMNGVIGMASILASTALTPEQQGFVKVIESSGRSLLALINDILDFSKIAAGKLELENALLDINEVAEDALEVVSSIASEKAIDLRYNLGNTPIREVKGDPHRVRQVILNLLANAIKFTQKGSVTLAIHSEGETCQWLCLTVTDTGIGITRKQMANLFRSFSQAESSTTRKFGGSGLGLLISQRLAHMMGGEIVATSEFGRGSTFSFRLPVRVDQSAERGTSFAVKGQHQRLLVISDDHLVRQSLANLCRFSGFGNLDVAGSSHLASVAAPSYSPYDAVLVDCGDERDELFKWIQRLEKLDSESAVRFLFWGRRRDQDTVNLMARVRRARYFVKPALKKHIVQALADFLQQDAPAADKTKSVLKSLKGRILVAEDNYANQLIVQKMLKMLGCECELVGDGVLALAALEAQPYDLVLMDCQMPRMDGYRAAQAIRNDNGPSARVPIVALTASALPEDRQHCLDSGMNDFLAKPIDLMKLHGALSRWLKPI